MMPFAARAARQAGGHLGRLQVRQHRPQPLGAGVAPAEFHVPDVGRGASQPLASFPQAPSRFQPQREQHRAGLVAEVLPAPFQVGFHFDQSPNPALERTLTGRNAVSSLSAVHGL